MKTPHAVPPSSTLDSIQSQKMKIRAALPTLLAFLLAALASANCAAQQTGPGERKLILDAIRPAAAQQAGQAVRIKVDRLNVDGGWAVLTGELVSPSGTDLDWSRASDCHPDLDKMLWVVLKKSDQKWKPQQLEICASEPPYWYLDQGHLDWPCGVYAGLQAGDQGTLEGACRSQRRSKPEPAETVNRRR